MAALQSAIGVLPGERSKRYVGDKSGARVSSGNAIDARGGKG